MIDSIILAAGCSSRTQSNKLLFKINGFPLIFYTIQSAKSVSENVMVVVGFYNKELFDYLDTLNVKVIKNENYLKGMFTSVKCGITSTNNDILVFPGDCPFVKKETILNLINSNKNICVPLYKEKEGHPIFIKKELKNEILKEDDNYNLKDFKNKIGYEKIIVEDKNVINDIDTKEDYEILKKEFDKEYEK